MELSDRKKLILKMIIDAYIDSGEPVGSKYLTQSGGLGISSATIRNEMSELEEMGYLDKPHTSAGRIPSTSGYRFYVDRLMEDYRLNLEELELLQDLTRYKVSETERLIERVGRVMSGVTRYASVSLASKPSGTHISRYDAVWIDKNSFLLVMISKSGDVKTCVISHNGDVTKDDMERIKTAVNRHLVNIPLDSVGIQTLFALEEDLGRLKEYASRIVRGAYDATRDGGFESMKVDGVTNLLEYPEFSDINKIKSLMSVFEQRGGSIKQLISSADSEELTHSTSNDCNVKIIIGDDSEDSVLSDTSLVYCTVPIGEQNAVIGVLGPKRMDYKKVISSLKYFAIELADTKQKTNQTQALPEGSNEINDK